LNKSTSTVTYCIQIRLGASCAQKNWPHWTWNAQVDWGRLGSTPSLRSKSSLHCPVSILALYAYNA